MSELVPAQPLDVVAWVTVRLHQSGTISTLGTIADKPMAKHLLETALGAIGNLPEYRQIIVPGSEVEVSPAFLTRDMGNIPLDQRGVP
jgi:hypothetical protein